MPPRTGSRSGSKQFMHAPRIIRACVAAALLVLIFFMLRGIVDRFVYYPMPYPQGEWELQSRAGAQDLWLTTADGIRLNAWWFPKPDSHFAILLLHGNAGNVTHRIDHAHAITSAGSSVLIVDYRGYGKSNGPPSEPGLRLDAAAGYEGLLQLGYAPNRIILPAESLGTAVPAELAASRTSTRIDLASPLMSLS